MRRPFLFLTITMLLLGSLISNGMFRAAPAGKVVDDSLAAETDSRIYVCAFFSKNDTMRYVRNKVKFKVIGNDTTQQGVRTESEFMIIVKDSTEKSYTMEYVPLGFRQYKGDTPVNSPTFETPAIKQLANLRCVFTTDEYGTLTGIKNWKEIRDKAGKAMDAMLDSVYRASPGLDSVMPRNRYKSMLTLSLSSEQGVMSLYDELQLLFCLHGKVFDLGNTGLNEQDKDSTVYAVNASYMDEDEREFEGDYKIYGVTSQNFTKEETSKLLSGVFGMFLTDSVSGKMDKLITDSLSTGISLTNLEDYRYFFNGWPSLMKRQKIIEVMGQEQITVDMLEWKERAWQNVWFKWTN